LSLSSTSHATKHHIIFGEAGNNVYDEANDRWGFGTASPEQKLHLRSSAFIVSLVETTGANQAGLDIKNSEGHIRLFTDDGGFRVFDQTDNAMRIIVDTIGNVGINEASPDSQLEVNGLVHSTSLDGGALNITTNASGQIIRDPSDIRFKKLILDIQSPLDKILALHGVTYNWQDMIERKRPVIIEITELIENPKTGLFDIRKTKKQKVVDGIPQTEKYQAELSMGDQRDYGLIAQEVEIVVPELVSTGSDGYKGVKYTNAVALLVEAIKELNARIITLEAR
jgi:hypothetical protein